MWRVASGLPSLLLDISLIKKTLINRFLICGTAYKRIIKHKVCFFKSMELDFVNERVCLARFEGQE